MAPCRRMADVHYNNSREKLPKEPVSLRIAYTEEHQWKKVNNHLMICPGYSCIADLCLYIRHLISHDMEDCEAGCQWCSKIIRWLRIHKQSCTPKRCPYYTSCFEIQKKILRISTRRHSDPRLSSAAMLSFPDTIKTNENNDVLPYIGHDDDSCCSDAIKMAVDYDNKLLKQALSDIYQNAVEEEFSESENFIKDGINCKFSVKQALVAQLKNNRGYQEGRHWRRIRQIGSGGSGKAFCIEDVHSELCLALKEEPDGEEAEREVFVSFHISSLLKDHPPNIVEFYGAALLPVPYSAKMQLFLELMPCCLQSYLYNSGPLSMENCHNYACQLFEALEFLHQKVNIVHADIKPGNLLVDETNQKVKLADFGCSQILEDYHHQAYCMRGDPRAGTIHYNPPEHYAERRCSYSLDIWQAGCCMIAMVTGRRPWRGIYPDCINPKKDFYKFQVHKIAEACRSGQSHLIPGLFDDAMTHLIRRCLTYDYRKRPSPQECLSLLVKSDIVSKDNQHRWLSQLTPVSSTLSIPLLKVPSCSSSEKFIIDVYLGSHLKSPAPVYCLLPGWLGSFQCEKNTSYGYLIRHYIPSYIPIVASFPEYYIKICENVPHLIWEKSRIDDSTATRTITSRSILKLQTPCHSNTIDPLYAVVLVIS